MAVGWGRGPGVPPAAAAFATYGGICHKEQEERIDEYDCFGFDF